MTTFEELKQVMQNAGIVGAGGAGFPSFAKLAEGADTLVINGAECEPMLYTDYSLMSAYLPLVVEGATIVMRAVGMKRCLIGIKKHNCIKLGLSEGQELAPDITVKQLPNVYPMGDEIALIYETTGRLVQPGQLPITQGVIVFNLETIFNIRNAVVCGTVLTEKTLTINGDIDNPVVVKAPIGMRVSDLFSRLGIRVPEGDAVLDGGPSMGRIVNPNTHIVTKTTKSLIIIPENTPAVMVKQRKPEAHLAIASSVCCQCTRCTDLCPRFNLGYPLEPHKHVRVAASALGEDQPELIKTASLCSSCGVCEILACCQYISPRAVIAKHKAILAKDHIRFSAPEGKTYTIAEDRPLTRVHSVKWMESLGIRKYDKTPTYVPELQPTNHVEIRMNPHIGAPSVPCVNVGDHVTKGQRIADPGTGLSIPQHATIDGKVIFVDPTKIIIEN